MKPKLHTCEQCGKREPWVSSRKGGGWHYLPGIESKYSEQDLPGTGLVMPARFCSDACGTRYLREQSSPVDVWPHDHGAEQ